MSNLLRQTLAKIPNETRAWVSKSFDITDQILDILENKKISQSDLAHLLDLSESEINLWLTGTYNFTEENIAKIELALGEPITLTIKQAEEKYKNLTLKIAKYDKQFRLIEDFLKKKGIEPDEYNYAIPA